MPKSIRDLALKHVELKAELDRLKKAEAELRAEIVDLAIAEHAAQIGTTNIEVQDMKIKVTRSYNYKLDAAKFDELEDLMSDAEMSCINLKPSLDLRKYKATAEVDTLNECIEVKEAMPTVKVELGE